MGGNTTDELANIPPNCQDPSKTPDVRIFQNVRTSGQMTTWSIVVQMSSCFEGEPLV